MRHSLDEYGAKVPPDAGVTSFFFAKVKPPTEGTPLAAEQFIPHKKVLRQRAPSAGASDTEMKCASLTSNHGHAHGQCRGQVRDCVKRMSLAEVDAQKCVGFTRRQRPKAWCRPGPSRRALCGDDSSKPFGFSGGDGLKCSGQHASFTMFVTARQAAICQDTETGRAQSS